MSLLSAELFIAWIYSKKDNGINFTTSIYITGKEHKVPFPCTPHALYIGPSAGARRRMHTIDHNFTADRRSAQLVEYMKAVDA